MSHFLCGFWDWLESAYLCHRRFTDQAVSVAQFFGFFLHNVIHLTHRPGCLILQQFLLWPLCDDSGSYQKAELWEDNLGEASWCLLYYPALDLSMFTPAKPQEDRFSLCITGSEDD